MSRDKQIEEIKALNLLLEDITVDKVLFTSDGEAIDVITVHAVEGSVTNQLANILYANGYRKASTVAREIFEEILLLYKDSCDADFEERFAELRKKYESEGAYDESEM